MGHIMGYLAPPEESDAADVVRRGVMDGFLALAPDTPEGLEAYIRDFKARTGAPVFYSETMVRRGKEAGVDMDALIAEGCVAIQQPIPVSGPIFTFSS